MDTYDKISKLNEMGIHSEDLWEEMLQWLDADRMSEFIDDYITNNDLEAEFEDE